jgi:hypothetical protein
MSATVDERLNRLLPAVVRTRDVEQGEPLRALLAVIERELAAVEGDLDELYENWFVETCAEWVVPYIGDLLGVRGLHAVSPRTSSARAVVANTLAYRRRKGTASMLEQLARDLTGWPARAVEMFELLSTTQNLNHLRPANVRTPDLRAVSRLELLDGPFDSVAHTVDVRSIERRRGRHNIPNVGLFLWRLQSYPLTGVTPRAVTEPSDGRYTFSPLGIDAPLFNRPRGEPEITHLAEEADVPDVPRLRKLHEELEALKAGTGSEPVFFSAERPLIEVVADGQAKQPTELVACDLSDPPLPPPEGWPRPPAGSVAFDPRLGRIAFAAGQTPATVSVSWAYGFGGDVGGGPYERTEAAAAALGGPVTWQRGVSASATPVPDVIVSTLGEAVQAWNAEPAPKRGVIAILDSATYAETLTGSKRIVVPDGSELLVVAADWPEPDRALGHFVASEARPHLLGDLEVRGSADPDAVAGGLALNGLLVEGSLTVAAGDLGELRLADSTLVPGGGGLVVESSAGQENDRLELHVERAIVAAIELPETVAALGVADSIVGEGEGAAIAAPGTALDVQRATLLGETACASLEAGNSIFGARVVAARRQLGCVRFSYVPRDPDPAADSRTPRRYRCQPDLALAGVLDPAEGALIRSRVAPMLSASEYGRPDFCQLARACAEEIRTGAEDGSEMGAFSSLRQPQREANLRASLAEYLRFGLEAGIFYVT